MIKVSSQTRFYSKIIGGFPEKYLTKKEPTAKVDSKI